MSMGINSSQITRKFTDFKNYLQFDEDLNRMKRVKKQIKNRRTNFMNLQKTLGNSSAVMESVADNEYQLLRQFKYHRIPFKQLYKQLGTNPQKGLSTQVVEQRLQQLGENKMPQINRTNPILLFLLQMSDPFSLFLWAITVACLILYGIRPFDISTLLLAIILLVTVIGGALISYFYNKRTEQTVIEFTDLIPQFCNVIRNNKIQLINSSELVSGDILKIAPGDKIAADCRIIETYGLKINTSMLTGQNQTMRATVECTNAANPLKTTNMIYSGCINEQGEGTVIVISTGKKMLISEIANLIIQQSSESTVMQQQIARYVKIMTIWCLFMFSIVWLVGTLNGFFVIIAFQMGVGVMVASCPGVLNLVFTIIMTYGVSRLAQIKFIVKNFYVMEALGATTCLCTDKTGTITVNKMTVSNLWYNRQSHKADSYINGKHFPYQYDINEQNFKQLQKCAILASAAKFVNAPSKQMLSTIYSDRKISFSQKQVKQKQLREQISKTTEKKNIIGDSTQIALINFFEPIENVSTIREKYPVLKNKKGSQLWLPFNSARKYSISINHQQQGYSIYTKGAPEKIIQLCSHVIINNQIQPKTQQFVEEMKMMNKKFTQKGQRVIAFSMHHIKKNKDPDNILVNKSNQFYQQVFLGLISLNDPPKPKIANSIIQLKAAGIKIVMITGDHEQTAKSIAKSVKIIQEDKTINQILAQDQQKRKKMTLQQLKKTIPMTFEQARKHSKALIVNGEELTRLKMQDQGLPESLRGRKLKQYLQIQQVIFARTTPAQKLMIVQTLQKMGHVVAVCGDGVNDSPALKRADVGVCMFSGADASKQAADIILADDNLCTIVDGIKQGRKIFDNMKKSICYVMTSQVSEFVPFLILISLRIPIPIFTLLVDGIVDFFPSACFIFEQPEAGIMTRMPRDRTEHLVNFKLLIQCSGWMGISGFLACFAAYWVCMNDFGFQINYLWKKSNIPMIIPQYTDVYNPSRPDFGNSNLALIKTCGQFDSTYETTDWINANRPWVDLRMSVVLCHEQNGKAIFTQNMIYSQCHVQQISVYTNRPVCYTTQATKYGQTSYMMANVVDQVFNLFICKTRRQSVFSHGIYNKFMYFGLAMEYLLSILLTQAYFMIYLIGTRDLLFVHFGITAILIGMVQLLLDQGRKWLIRNLPKVKLSAYSQEYKPNWFERNTLW